MNKLYTYSINVPSFEASKIQEAHSVPVHILGGIVESELFNGPGLTQGLFIEIGIPDEFL